MIVTTIVSGIPRFRWDSRVENVRSVVTLEWSRTFSEYTVHLGRRRPVQDDCRQSCQDPPVPDLSRRPEDLSIITITRPTTKYSNTFKWLDMCTLCLMRHKHNVESFNIYTRKTSVRKDRKPGEKVNLLFVYSSKRRLLGMGLHSCKEGGLRT